MTGFYVSWNPGQQLSFARKGSVLVWLTADSEVVCRYRMKTTVQVHHDSTNHRSVMRNLNSARTLPHQTAKQVLSPIHNVQTLETLHRVRQLSKKFHSRKTLLSEKEMLCCVSTQMRLFLIIIFDFNARTHPSTCCCSGSKNFKTTFVKNSLCVTRNSYKVKTVCFADTFQRQTIKSNGSGSLSSNYPANNCIWCTFQLESKFLQLRAK